ncbi:MAG: O-antigen ligase family protein, partial [Actinomycetota bacterium]
MIAVIFILSGINTWINKPEIENRQLLMPLFIFAGYSFIQGLSTLLLPFYPTIFPESFDAVASIWNGFKILAFALFLGLLLKSSRPNLKFLTWSLIITGNFFAVFGIARFLLQPDSAGEFESLISPQLTAGIGFGTYVNQNHFAYLMLMVFGLNICLFWYGNLSKGTRLLLLPASVITWTALVLTASRGGIISSFAEIAVLILLPLILKVGSKSQSRKSFFQSKVMPAGKQLLILPIIFVLLIIGIALIGQDRVVERFEEIPRQLEGVTNAATFRRTDVWLAAGGIIKAYPVFGIGFGGFKIAVSQYIDISGQLVPKQAHND